VFGLAAGGRWVDGSFEAWLAGRVGTTKRPEVVAVAVVCTDAAWEIDNVDAAGTIAEDNGVAEEEEEEEEHSTAAGGDRSGTRNEVRANSDSRLAFEVGAKVPRAAYGEVPSGS